MSGFIPPASIARGPTRLGPTAHPGSTQMIVVSSAGIESYQAVPSGDVVGPASSTDEAVVRFDSTTGKLVQNSGVTISDANAIRATKLMAGVAAGAPGFIDYSSAVSGAQTFGVVRADSEALTSLHAMSLICQNGFFHWTGTIYKLNTQGTSLDINDTMSLRWSPTGNGASADVGIGRNAAGVVEVNNGTLGTLRDFKARDLIPAQRAQHAEFTVVTLPTPAPGRGHAFAIDGRKAGEGVGAGTGIPVWDDGTNWRTFYDNSIAAA